MKKIVAAIMAGVLTLSVSFITQTQAATRDEIAAIRVSRSGKFNYWTKDSVAKQKLIDYVRDVTNKRSKNYIPVEDRIAVFDMDGTFLCETAPYYFDGMLYIHRVLYDENYNPSQEEKNFASSLKRFITSKNPGDKLGSSAPHQAAVFEGMTYPEYTSYVENFMKMPVDGLTNLKWGEAFYLPMVEVIKYLQKNDFKVYVVSGSERQLIRVLLRNAVEIPENQIIGTDIKIYAKNQGDTDGLDYDYNENDYLTRGEFVIKNLKMNKVSAIYREIGKQPVLAFGNSSGDLSMLNYTINGNKYKSAVFFVLCDDVERDFGDISKAEKCRKLAEENGWTSISMHNDWITIYGDDVRKMIN